MAYSKQTWTDDVSAVTGARMTHIEQGIYDNSLATDKINPSGTATTTAEIEAGQINDVIGFKSLKLKGQTSQYTTTGKNLLNLTNGTYTNSGITGVVNNGVITLNGTASANSFLSIPINSTFQANKSYAISANNTQTIGGGKNTAYACIRLSTAQSDDTEADVLFNVANNSIAITKTSETVYTYFRVRTGSGLVYNNFVIKPQIEQATSATSYEPYTGLKASPNPDFPQEVENVSGYNVVEINNKNVLPNPIKSQTLNGITITRNSDGTLLINGTATANTYFDFSTDFDTTKYTGYKFYGFPNNPGFRIRISNSDRVSIQEIETNGTVIANNGTGKYIAIRIASGANVNNRLLSPMLIAPSTTDTSYIAHQGNDFELNLGDIEICKIGTYQDYIFKKDGKWYKHKEIGKVILDDTLTYSYSSYFGAIIWTNNSIANVSDNTQVGAISDKAIGISPSALLNSNGIVQNNSNNRILVKFDGVANYNTDALAKQYFGGNNFTVYYILATPIEEEITYAPLIRQLEELYNSGLYDNTNISQDNSNEAFILDLEACKNNINGIVEYIRR